MITKSDPVAILAAIQKLYKKFKKGEMESSSDPKFLKRFDRKELTFKLLELYESLI